MLHSVVIEVRQHLCCANVFIKLQNTLKGDPESIIFNVDENKILLQNPKNKAAIEVNKYFKILPETFSNLIVDTENTSFRVSIKDVLVAEEDDETYGRNALQLNITEGNRGVALQCSNCEAILVLNRKYDKIREFPTGTIDASEFFCHHGPSFKDALVPNENALFYGFEFIVLNMTTIGEKVRCKENHIYCKRCLQYLGEELFNSRAAKLWSDSIRFNIKEEITEIFVSPNIGQIHKLILKAIEESSLPSPEPLLRNMHFTKVLLEATLPSRQQQFLLLHILEKNLLVLRNVEKAEVNSNNDSEEIELNRNKAFKILYRLIAKEENNGSQSPRWPALLEYWRQNINILKMKISPFLLSALHAELNSNIIILPETYRNSNDDFSLSYIFY